MSQDCIKAGFKVKTCGWRMSCVSVLGNPDQDPNRRASPPIFTVLFVHFMVT